MGRQGEQGVAIVSAFTRFNDGTGYIAARGDRCGQREIERCEASLFQVRHE